MREIKQLEKYLTQNRGKEQAIQETITDLESDIDRLQDTQLSVEKALEIVKQVGLSTQQQLQYHISDITSLALNSVFPDPYRLDVEFVERRNKTECDLLFNRQGSQIHPMESSGYGAVDVASFALRVASWSMRKPRYRATIILDEPMKFLSKDRQANASLMLKELSEKLGIQFIIVTHEDALTQHADKTFQVTLKNGKSQV